jgi:anti-sigma factor RsiW
MDNELDAAAHAEIEQHIDGCAACRTQLDELISLRQQLKRSLSSMTAPPRLRNRIEQALNAEADAAITPSVQTSSVTRSVWRQRSFWLGALSGVGLAAASALFAVLLVTRLNNPLVDEMVAAHVQSLRSGELIAVESTDRHTVKPWFAGRADVSPAVADFAAQGYRLVGGRVDNIAQQRAAVLVYQHGAHVINVFSWVAQHPLAITDTTRNGYHLACWQAGNLDYCAMSDTGWQELRGLEQLLNDLATREQRPQ